jgi:hypothetical protein
MNSYPLALLSLAGLLLAGCLSAAAAEALPIRTLAKGAFGGIQEPRQEIIQDKAAWEKVWAKHAGEGRAPGSLPEVDFSKDMVILVTMGRKNTGGYGIQITQVEPVGNKLQISVKRTNPPPGAMTIQALTAPFHMVAVPRSDLVPEFVPASPAKSSQKPGDNKAIH